MRKKSENRSNIMSPLHFGHSIGSSQVVMSTAEAVAKQEPNQFLLIRNFNTLAVKYLSASGRKGGSS